MANSDHYPASGKAQPGRGYSGTGGDPDPTSEKGYPPGDWGTALFGGPLPMGTGAPGSPGGGSGATDPTNEPGQTQDGLTGVTEDQITRTGAPGTQGAAGNSSGGTGITYTTPSDGIGPYSFTTVSDALTGPRDSTQANEEGYATGGPQLPGIKGNEPEAGEGRFQPGGSGHVMRGGRAVRG